MATNTDPVPELTADEDKLNFKVILPILVIVLVDLLGLTIIIPLLPFYATSFGASPFVIGLLSAAYPIFQFIGAPILGRLSDRYGRKPVLVISQIGTFIGFLVMGFANSLFMLFLSRIIDGISGANIATAQAAIADSTTEKNRTQGLGLIGAAFGIGFIIGPIIAGVSLLLSGNNYRVPAFIAALFSLASILLTAFWFKETLPDEERGEGDQRPSFSLGSLLRAMRHPTVGFLLILMFLQQIAFGGFEQILALFTLSRLGLNAVGNTLIFVFVGLILIVVQGGLIGRWSRQFGDRKLVLTALVLLSIGLIAVGLTPTQTVPWYSQAAMETELSGTTDDPSVDVISAESDTLDLPDDSDAGWLGLIWFLAAMVPIAVGGAVLRPGINSLITKRVSLLEMGGILGISAAFSSAANALAPVIGGAVFDYIGPTAPFIAWGILIGVLYFVSVRRIKPSATDSAESPPASAVH
ncbi:MAG: MFS transporter [Anaerolineae bacterium]|nr:MFS transporter [Anaerolineae bacterium]